MRLFFYAHGGSGNHGCEAIVRSTIKLLGVNDVTLISSKPEEDKFYGVDKICNVIRDVDDDFSNRSIDFLKAYAALKLKKDYIPMDKLRYKAAFNQIQKNDIALSIGGDNYCYADVQKYIMMHDMLKKRGAKTVLWGCSVEPEVAERPEIAADLMRYDLIVARETITQQALRMINSNTVLMPDPAFFLDAKETKLPDGFIPGNTVGINLSPMAIANESIPGMAEKNYRTLIEFVLKETNMNIALIPHVVWKDGDDQVPLRDLYHTYEKSGRVSMVEDQSCEKLKYIISKCRFFVGARTHSTIAAYSSCVPTLVLGYSVKARGIARDLFGTDAGYAIPVQRLENSNVLCEAFKELMSSELEVQKILLNDAEFRKKCAISYRNICFSSNKGI